MQKSKVFRFCVRLRASGFFRLAFFEILSRQVEGLKNGYKSTLKIVFVLRSRLDKYSSFYDEYVKSNYIASKSGILGDVSVQNH